MRFFNLGAGELMLIFLLAVLAVGPKETVRLAGEAREIFKSIQGVFSEMTSEVTRATTSILDDSKSDNDKS
ncbi:MAG: twin-arginine translocase TatA/TatE family subunit [Anaerolineae bacterium]|nr:twin-arginine translocase TatA/TatE family subunit [Anaerolineae bacterium]MBL6966269.1 twin-arginine translocase TatA/TatE family subunit [Anaerolineales bacterium]